jgi:hypothetical protein
MFLWCIKALKQHQILKTSKENVRVEGGLSAQVITLERSIPILESSLQIV